jgi:hypothetical protein
MDNIKEKINEIDELLDRATGRTTRLIDQYVQDIFNHPNEWQKITDHWQDMYPKRTSRHIFDKLMNRLRNEHPGEQFEHRWTDNYKEVRLVKQNSSDVDRYKLSEVKRLFGEIKELYSKRTKYILNECNC